MKGDTMNFQYVIFEEKDSVGFITMNNPENMNPATVDAMKELIECLNYCEKNDTVRAIVIRGAGGNFSAGGNVTMPLADAFWGAYFGMLIDKFGINWMVNYTYPQK